MTAPLPAIGDVLGGKYRVESVLATGGMGIVLSAMHLRLHERVAIKVLKPEIAVRADAVARFMREARMSMKLRGEHVVRIFDVDVLGDSLPYFVMELLEGEDLAVHIAGQGSLPWLEVVDCILQACEGVAEAHALGIVHRDLKPANLFLARKADGESSLKVLDFGVSKASAWLLETDAVTSPASDPNVPAARSIEDADASLTHTTAMIGSPRYMSPEQSRSARDVDARSDVWALGAIAYEMLTGEPPFSHNNLDTLRAAIVNKPHKPLESGSPRLRAVVDRCLEKSPNDRFQDVAMLADALAELGDDAMRRRAARVRVMLGRPERPRTSRGFVATAAVVAAAVVVAIVARSGPAAVQPTVPALPPPRESVAAVVTTAPPSAHSQPPLVVASTASPPRMQIVTASTRAAASPASSSPGLVAPFAPAASVDPETVFDRPE